MVPALNRRSDAAGQPRRGRTTLVVLTAGLLMLVLAAPAGATLQLRKPDPNVGATFVGRGGYSSDGLGQINTTGGTVQAVVPAGSTVRYAFLYGTYNTGDPSAADRLIRVDTTNVQTTKIGQVSYLSTTFADVTDLVRAKVGSGGATYNFAINNDPSPLDGVALVVVYANPNLPQTTIAVLDGSSEQTGDQATFNFASPINPTSSGFNATLALGSGYSYQGSYGPTHQCGGGQFSNVEINNQLLTNCAGHYDDGGAANSALITVGGVGDSTDNPTPPNAPATDDELYNLVPFLKQGDTSLTIETSNPSQDDNLFLAIIATSAQAVVTTEICNNQVDDDDDTKVDEADPDCFAITLQHQGSSTNPVGQPHTVRSTVTNRKTNGPASGRVLFSVTGANTASGSQMLTSGAASFTYTGSNTGTDRIRACYDKSNDGVCQPDEPKATVEKVWTGGTPPPTGRRMIGNAVRGPFKYASIVDCSTATANTRKRPFTVEWTVNGVKRTFHTTNYLFVRCDRDQAFPLPAAGFNRQDGTSEGTLTIGNGQPQPGYRLIWRLIDGGGSTASDRTGLIVKRAAGGVIREVGVGPPSSGQNTAIS